VEDHFLDPQSSQTNADHSDKEICVVGRDRDHPTEEQGRSRQYLEEWQKARERERGQLQRYGVYSKIDKIPDGVKPVDTKWVYVIKRRCDRSIEKFKARKVGRGFSQEKGENFEDTSAQIARLETWQILFTIALARGWKVRQ
jgi:hypothetical protein